MGLDSIWHWLILLVIILALFGTKKLTNIGPDLGKAVREFKRALRSGDKDDAADGADTLKADPPPQAPAASATQQQAEHESVHTK